MKKYDSRSIKNKRPTESTPSFRGQIKWFEALQSITPYIFKILTPSGGGTGFQMSCTSKGLCGIATAYHVIEHAYEWDEPIKITHYNSNKSLKLQPADRAIIPLTSQDLAFILFNKRDIQIEEKIPDIIPPQKILKQGVELGWCGFPSIAPNDLCFFVGYVSCCLKPQKSYLVDGVAINGVSGGPTFFISSTDNSVVIVGVITAYIPSRMYGESLPGLSYVRSVEPYQNMLRDLKSLNDAEKKADEQKLRNEKQQLKTEKSRS